MIRFLGLPGVPTKQAPEPSDVHRQLADPRPLDRGFLPDLALVLLRRNLWQVFPHNLTIPLQFSERLGSLVCNMPVCVDLRAMETDRTLLGCAQVFSIVCKIIRVLW